MTTIIPPKDKFLQIDSNRLAIYLTNKCNLKCKHCFIEGSPVNDDFLNWKQIKTAIKYFYEHNFRHVEVTGGESCLSPYFLSTIKEAKKLGYTVGVSTNGTNTHIFDTITPKTVDKITFSLDGSTAKTHNRLRGPGVYNLCLKNIKATLAQGFRVEVVYTAHRYNLKEIAPTIRLLDKLGVHRLSINFINNAGTANFNQHFLISPKQWLEVKANIFANYHPKHMELRFPPLFTTKKEFEAFKQNQDTHCLIADPVKIELYPDGYFYGCCFTTTSKDLSLGRVFNTHVEANYDNARKYVKKYSHLSCPAIQTDLVFSGTRKFVPVCVYLKHIIKPQT